MEKDELQRILEHLYKDLCYYYDSQSEYGIGYVDGIYDVCAKVGIHCSKIDEGHLKFGD